MSSNYQDILVQKSVSVRFQKILRLNIYQKIILQKKKIVRIRFQGKFKRGISIFDLILTIK